MRKFLTLITISLTTTAAMAQLSQNNQNFLAESMPETMAPAEGVLMQEYNNRTYLTENRNNNQSSTQHISPVQYPNTSGSALTTDQIIEERLNRIPTTIDLTYNDISKGYINKYAKMKHHVSVMLGAMNFYRPIFEEALERYGIPYELAYLPVIESSLRPTAVSPAGAAGLWQFIPSTGKRYGLIINTLVDERRDPIKSTDAACRYLRDMYNRFGDWSLAIAGYNCGEGAVQKALARSGGREGKTFWDIYKFLPKETRGYVPAFIGATYIMTYYCEHDISPMRASLPENSDTIMVEKDVRLSKVASACGISLDQMKALNPQFKQDVVPANYAIRLPSDAIDAFVENQETIYSGNVTARAYYAENNSLSRSRSSRHHSRRR